MIALKVHDVVWSSERGHPLVVLRVERPEPEFLSVIVSPDDALLVALGAKVVGVEFRLQRPSTLVALVVVEGAAGSIVTLPANFADALAIAVRASAPIRIGEADLEAVMPTRGAGTQPPRAFRSLIESLNLSGIGDEGRATA